MEGGRAYFFNVVERPKLYVEVVQIGNEMWYKCIVILLYKCRYKCVQIILLYVGVDLCSIFIVYLHKRTTAGSHLG